METTRRSERSGRTEPCYAWGRVVLRELRREDLEEMERWPKYSEPDLRWANFDLHTPAQKDLWFRQEVGDPSRRRFAILVEGRVIGMLGLRHIDYRQRRATLGIRLSAGEVNKGYGTEAIKALLAYAFGTMKLNRIDLDVLENNIRARRCYEKCGFRVTGSYQDYTASRFIEMAAEARDFLREHQARRELPE